MDEDTGTDDLHLEDSLHDQDETEEEDTFHHYLMDDYFQRYISLDSTVTEKVVITAIIKNDVATLKKFMQEPIFIKTHSHYSLLHIAIEERSRDVFDYLLEIGCPMDLKSKSGYTPFVSSIEREVLAETEYFAVKLVNNGAELEVPSFLDSPLDEALHSNCYDLSKLLITKLDADKLNLDHAVASDFSEEETIELVCSMIYHGADVWVKDSYGFTPFDLSLETKFYKLQEILFDYYIDDLTESYEIQEDIEFLICAFRLDSPTLPKLLPYLKLSEKIKQRETIVNKFLLIKPVYLEWLIKNYKHTVKDILINFIPSGFDCLVKDRVEEIQYSGIFTCLELLLKNPKFRLQVLNYFQDASWYRTTWYCKAVLSELLLLLLSYGMELNMYALKRIYNDYGYCDLFKTLLFMDIAWIYEKKHYSCIVAAFIYDVHLTLEEFLKDCPRTFAVCLEDLSPYFAYSRFRNASSPFIKRKEEAVMAPFSTLKELARDASRKFIVDKFNVKNSRQFYTILNKLHIADVYKKIISFETKLYD